MKENSQSPIKAAIVYLARSRSKDINELKRSLSLLDMNFNDEFKYPVIIFHEDFDEKLMANIRKSTHSDLNFEKILFETPDFLKKEEIPEIIFVDGFEFSIGFRHMCRFFSGLIFQHYALKDYDYLWRLDTDSFLLDKIDYDIFQFMQENNYMYGYIHILKEHPDAVKGFWNIVKKYIHENNIQPTFLNKFIIDGSWDRSYYYANFEVSKLDFWRSEDFLKYFNYIDKSGGTYKYRWGDTIIHFLAISMFIPENRIHKFSDISYQHQDFINNYSINLNIFEKSKKFLILNFIKLSNNLKRQSNVYRKLLDIIKKWFNL